MAVSSPNPLLNIVFINKVLPFAVTNQEQGVSLQNVTSIWKETIREYPSFWVTLNNKTFSLDSLITIQQADEEARTKLIKHLVEIKEFEDVDVLQNLENALDSKNIPAFKTLIENELKKPKSNLSEKELSNFVHAALIKNNPELTDILLKTPTPFSTEKLNEFLNTAIRSSNIKAAKTLLELGADPSKKCKTYIYFHTTSEIRPLTAFETATLSQNPEIISLLKPYKKETIKAL